MELDQIIAILEKYTFTTRQGDGEIDEEDAAAPTGGATGGGGSYPGVTKWETGLVRSNANTIDDKVTWKSLNKIVRGKANTLL